MINVDNGWYARGEFPPAGVVCEMWDVSGWNPASIIGRDDQGLCVASVHFDEHSGYRASPLVSDFRPIKTEPELQRDVDIREALEHIKQDWYAKPGATVSEYVVNAITQLYDAGWRKQMSRYEVNSILMSVPHVPIGDNCRHAILDALGYGKE
jgi:hypothetical protein